MRLTIFFFNIIHIPSFKQVLEKRYMKESMNFADLVLDISLVYEVEHG